MTVIGDLIKRFIAEIMLPKHAIIKRSIGIIAFQSCLSYCAV